MILCLILKIRFIYVQHIFIVPSDNMEQFAFWVTTAGIIIGAVAAFFIVYSYLKSRRVL